MDKTIQMKNTMDCPWDEQSKHQLAMWKCMADMKVPKLLFRRAKPSPMPWYITVGSKN